MVESYRILVIDDEEDILAITKKSLQRYGHAADVFSNSAEALAHFTRNPQLYDIVISDIRMPGLKGFELAKQAKELNPKVKVFLMSAYEVRSMEISPFDPDTKVDDFLQKPFHPDFLCLTIRKHMTKAR